MKLSRFIPIVLIAAFSLFPACDVIEDPVVPFSGEYIIEVYGNPPVFQMATTSGKNVLVEDFTAHQCGNCPPAAEIAEGLAESNPDRVFPLAIHAGNLAITNDDYPIDWTNEDSNIYWAQLDFQANPLGRINRKGGTGDFFTSAEWSEEVTSELASETPLQLQVKTFWHPSAGNNGQLNIHVNGQFTSGDLGGECRLAILFTESQLIGDQLYYGNDPEHITDYQFDHLLRGSVTGAEGLVVIVDALEGDGFQSDYTFNWNPEWIFENTSVVVIASSENGEVVNCLSHHLSDDDGSCLLVGAPCDDGNSDTVNDTYDSDCECGGEFGVPGCTDMQACNYNQEANFNDGSCFYAGDPCDDGNADTVNDNYDSHCVCDGEVGIVSGCTYETACNYNPEANQNDMSCLFTGDACDDNDASTGNDTYNDECECEGEALQGGCTYEAACNYDPEAEFDNNTCLFVGDPCDDGNPNTVDEEIQEDCECAE
jgi:thiol-disulfide isomerase/thioredoxin